MDKTREIVNKDPPQLEEANRCLYEAMNSLLRLKRVGRDTDTRRRDLDGLTGDVDSEEAMREAHLKAARASVMRALEHLWLTSPVIVPSTVKTVQQLRELPAVDFTMGETIPWDDLPGEKK